MTIVLFCNNHEQYLFFRRCVRGIEKLDKRALFLSHRWSVVLRAKIDGYNSCLLHGFKKSGNGSLGSDPDIAFEVRHGLLSPGQACRLVQRVEGFAKSFFVKERPDQIWFWDGCNLMRQTLAQVGKEFGVQTLFFQLGNFPGKLFVDTLGVNARSDFTHRLNTIDPSANVDWELYRIWKERYLEKKKKKHVVKQRSSLVKFNWPYAFDLFGFSFLGAPANEKQKIFLKIINYAKSRFIDYDYDNINGLQDGNFFLFPLQVNSGSQVLWNSKIGQLEAIRICHEKAKSEGVSLVVKAHPVEDDMCFIMALFRLRDELKFRIVNNDLFQLLQCCRRIITLNSTAGLEAMLVGKPVEILSDAHYANFSEADLAFYIQRFLLDIDFFTKNDLSDGQLLEIFERANSKFWQQFEASETLCQ